MKTTITYFNDGSKKIITPEGLEIWQDQDNKIHKAVGPAKVFRYTNIDLDEDSSTYLSYIPCINEEWYWHGKKIEATSQKQFEQLVKLLVFV